MGVLHFISEKLKVERSFVCQYILPIDLKVENVINTPNKDGIFTVGGTKIAIKNDKTKEIDMVLFCWKRNPSIGKKRKEKKALEKPNSKHTIKVNSPLTKESAVVSPSRCVNENICQDRKNTIINYEERRRLKIAALERRRWSRERSSMRLKARIMEKKVPVNAIRTIDKFLGGTVDSSTISSGVGSQLVPPVESKLIAPDSTSIPVATEPRNETKKMNTTALVLWINQLLKIDRCASEDICAFSERARNKADEVLRAVLENPELTAETVSVSCDSPEEMLKREQQWEDLLSRANSCVKSLGILEKVKTMVREESNITVEDLRMDADIGLQRETTDVLFGFSPVWLHLAIECVFGVRLRILNYSTSRSVYKSFLRNNVFSDERITGSKRFCPTGMKSSITKLGVKKLQNHFIVKMIQLLAVIEYLQRFNIMGPAYPAMFTSRSRFQSTKDIVGWIRSTFISPKFNLTNAMKKIGIFFIYEQAYYHNHTYLVDDISKDLCDGFILAKVAERIFKIENEALLSSLRPPNGDRIRKLGNVRIVLRAIKEHKIDLKNIKAEDIVQGKKPLIEELLQKIIEISEVQRN
uniref:Abnormal spindle-like microcephaly-associated protein (inferred by orthology to a human protein) n=1 Tax=Strongyloides venezuelensis TaxID=75913 RepID=A0A0K0FPN9_STRVS